MDRILVIDNDPEFRSALEKLLTPHGFQVHGVPTLSEASQLGRTTCFHAVVTAGADSRAIFEWAQQEQRCAALMIAVPRDSDGFGHAAPMSDGILARPFTDGADLAGSLVETLARIRARWERDALRRSTEPGAPLARVEPADEAGARFAAALRKAAEQPDPLLLTGEKGSLFRVFARELHGGGPFLCLSVSDAGEDAERELFGSETGAGLLDAAHGGTLLLEEIGHLGLRVQEKLLDYLKTGQFFRSGGERNATAKARLIAASRHDLEGAVESGAFHRGLCQLLLEHHIAIPPLRERVLDIVPLAEAALAEAAARMGRPAPALSDEAARALVQYSWPGNLEELLFVAQRAALVADGVVRVSHLMPDGEPPARERSWKEIERQAIEEALRATGGNRTRAARRLGMSLRKLQYRLQAYGIRRMRPTE